MSMDSELREAMRAYTAEVVPPAGLLGDVRRRAVRRRLRTRVAVVAAPVAVAGVVAAGTVVVPRLDSYTAPAPDQVAAALSAADRALLSGPTRGDLAGDAGYLAAVRAAWDRSHDSSPNADRGIFDHPVGPATVLWAGTTPVGPAAVVAQVFDLRQHDNVQLEREGPALLWGFVSAGTDGRPTVVADGYPVPGAATVEAAWIGPDRSVLLVTDRAAARAEVSWRLTYTDDGRVTRRWQPVEFSGGVALLRRPDGATPDSARLRQPGRFADIGNTPEPEYVTRPVETRLPWSGTDGRPSAFPVGTDPERAWTGRLPDADTAEAALDTGLRGRVPTGWPDVQSQGFGFWYAVGRTPDGSRLVAGEREFDGDPSRVYAALTVPGGSARGASGPVHRDSPVPVRLRLPDDQGWLVAAKGSELAWRTGTGAWVPAGRDAALLPAAATAVRAGTAVVVL